MSDLVTRVLNTNVLSDGGLPVRMTALNRQRESLFIEVSVGKVMMDVFG